MGDAVPIAAGFTLGFIGGDEVTHLDIDTWGKNKSR